MGEQTDLITMLCSRQWSYIAGGRRKATYDFRADGTLLIDGAEERKWVLKDERTIILYYTDGNTCTYVFPRKKQEKVQGKTEIGNGTRWLKPL